LDLDQLVIFVRVASLKSFTRAAESLYLSQPTISARIKALENELDTILFDRSRPRDLSLTEQGLLFWDYAQQIINTYNHSLEKLKSKKKSAEEFLCIGSSSVPGIYILPSLIADFKHRFRRARLRVSIKDSANVIAGITNYIFDVGMVGYREDDARLEYIKIYDDELILITAAGFLSSKYPPGTALPLTVCLDLDFILREPGSATRSVLERSLNAKGYNVNDFSSLIYFDNLEGIKQAVRHGLGVSVVSKRSAEDFLASGLVDSYTIAELDLKRNFYAVYHRRRVLNRVARDFIAMVKESISHYQ